VAVRTKQLVKPVVLTNAGGATVYTVPASETTIVKRMTIVNASAAAVAVDVASGNPSPDIINNYTHWNLPVGAQLSVDLETWLVLTPGQRLWVVPSVANVVVFGAFGTELEGVAD
jgi:hypothetical protein